MRHSFLDQYSALESPVHRLDARAKIIAFLALIVIAVSTPPEAWTAFLGYGAFLVAHGRGLAPAGRARSAAGVGHRCRSSR